MKRLLGVALAGLCVLAGCSTNSHLITPDHERGQIMSPEMRSCRCCGDLACKHSKGDPCTRAKEESDRRVDP